MRLLSVFLLLLLAPWPHPADAEPANITVTDAWIRAVPGSDVAAAYFIIHNNGSRAATVIGVRTPAAGSAMIHETSLSGTRSTMRPREQLPLTPGRTVRLAPGGTHVMLMNLQHPLIPGERVALLLLLEGGASIPVTARVRALGEE